MGPPLPLIEAGSVIIVKKPYTNPRRRRIILRADQAFNGTGLFERSDTRIQIFDAAAGGTEITFNGADNVFTGAQLFAGVTLFAEAERPSTTANDIELRLSLTINGSPGLIDGQTLTAVEFTLDLFHVPFGPFATPLPSTAPAPALTHPKVDPGRFVQVRNDLQTQRRALVVVYRPQPFVNVELVLKPMTAQVEIFAAREPLGVVGPEPTEATHASPAIIDSTTIPADGTLFWAEGVTVSTALHDTGIQLGLRNIDDDGDRVQITNVDIEFIRMNNNAYPLTGDDACVMVSKAVTNSNLPNNATFAGPPGASPDPETFRIQIKGLPGGLPAQLQPRVRLERRHGAISSATHVYDTVHGNAGGASLYRTNQHVRLVSNTVDDNHAANQTVLVELEDFMEATLIIDGTDIGFLRLMLGRPAAEAGPKAIRTVDIHFVTLRGVNSDPADTIRRMTRNWAQLAIRFNLAAQETVDAVRNVLRVRSAATGNGTIDIDVTPSGGATHNVNVNISNGDSVAAIAGKIATAIAAVGGLTASAHRHQGDHLVMVNKGTDVALAITGNTAPSVVVDVPALSFNNTITMLEGSVLGLNFSDNNLDNIEMIAVGKVSILGTARAATGHDNVLPTLPGWQNVSILREESVERGAPNLPFTAGHEMGHALFNGGNAIHSAQAIHLFTGAGTSATDTLGASKRLSNHAGDPILDWNNHARTKPGTVLLQRR